MVRWSTITISLRIVASAPRLSVLISTVQSQAVPVVEIAALPHQPADRRHLRLRDPPAAPGRPGTPSVRLGHDCHLLSQAVENSTALTPKCESVHVAVSYLNINAFPVHPGRFLCSVSDHVFRLTVSARIASSQSPACRTPPGR